MAYTIMIDAGHGGSDPGAVYEGRREKDDALRLALAVGQILEDRGYRVLYTRTDDIYESPYQKAMEANEAEADFFVSIHRNSYPQNNVASGVETLVYDASGLKYQIAEEIDENLAELGFRDLGVKERPNLVVLRRTQMPSILVEAGFINSDKDNQLFDDEFDQIAQGIADGIIDNIPIEDSDISDDYRVQVGLYRNRNNAEALLNELLGQGFPAFVTVSDEFYAVQVGAFDELSDAVRMEQRLKRAGYDTLIVT